MNIYIGMRHDRLVKFRDELTAAIDANPSANDGATTVTLYGKPNSVDSTEEIEVSFSNDDMERDEISPDDVYVEVSA